MVAEDEEKNWKGIIISLVVIVFILSMIILAIALITPGTYFYSLESALGIYSLLRLVACCINTTTLQFVLFIANVLILLYYTPNIKLSITLSRLIRLALLSSGSLTPKLLLTVIST